MFLPKCVACDDWLDPDWEGVELCSHCFKELHFLKLPAHLPHLKKQYFERAYSAVAYEGLILDLIHRFKYNRQLFVGRELSKLFRFLPLSWKDYEAIVPVPLHWKRRLVRCFNQSDLLAILLGKERDIPVLSLLKRNKSQHHQTQLGRGERLTNVQGVFRAVNRKKRFKKVLLLDDVLTTGATVNEAAKTLRRSLKCKVDVLTVARSLG